jgi:hypothetical protein
MEVTSTNSSNYSTVSSTQTTTTPNENNSFDTLLNTQTQETIPISKMPRTPKIVEFLDRYNKFSTLSPTDEKIFREILSDNKLTKEEAESLSYKQVERISNLLTTNLPLSKEEFDAMPIVQMGVDLIATRITGNRQFNEAFYNTLKELDPEKKHLLESEVHNNLGQLYLGKELKATFEYWGSYLANPWEYDKMNGNFGKFIKDVINHHEAIINNPKVIDVIKPQYQNIVDVYKVLEKNYNEVISKTKNTNSENSTSSSISSSKTTTPITQEKKVNEDKSLTQSLYEDIISLLRTGFTVGELKAFEDRLKEILRMMQEKDSGKNITIEDIEEAIKQLEREILEAKKSRTGQVLIKTAENTDSSSNSSSDLETTIGNITNMLQKIKDSSKNTNVKNDEETKNEAYDKLKLLLKMS